MPRMEPLSRPGGWMGRPGTQIHPHRGFTEVNGDAEEAAPVKAKPKEPPQDLIGDPWKACRMAECCP